MKFSDITYDRLKWVAQYLLPALGTLYFTLAGIWGFPYGEQVVGSITALDTFLGILLGISNANYKGDGVLELDKSNPDKDTYRLVLDLPMEELADKKQITFKVKS